MQLAGATIVITGATGGIGAELAKILADRGARVIATGRNPDRLVTIEYHSDRIETIEADLATPDGREAAVALIGDMGPIDVLINNAGSQLEVDAADPPDWSLIESEIGINLMAPIHLVHLMLPQLLERTANNPEAAIVNITSALALAPKASAAPYCAAKAGLRSYTQALRHQLRDTPVSVVEALPPLVKTAMTVGRDEGGISPSECAGAIVDGLAAGKDEIYVGKANLLRHLLRLAPGLGAKQVINS